MMSLEKRQRMKSLPEQRLEALNGKGSKVPKHVARWVTLEADAPTYPTWVRA